jgi:N-acetylglucosaminyldiphosphoundecaprenol N-acetyl-beta-D-mannosaminyltransferase
MIPPAVPSVSRVNILGVGVSAITMRQALETIDHWIAIKAQHYVCVTGVHGVMESQRDDALRRIHNTAGLVTPDGMPLVWLSRMRGRHQVERVYGPDLMAACCATSVRKRYRHFLYGGAEGVAQRLAERLSNRFPGLLVAGWYTPPFRDLTVEEDREVISRINQAQPDIVWVGMSTPKQERWMHQHCGHIAAPVLIGVGAAFDFHAGIKRQAPYWMQRSGLEWSYRLMTEPRRLWRRYLTNNPLFIWRILLQATGVARYQL